MVKHRKRLTADTDIIKMMLSATKRNKMENSLVTKKQPVIIQELFSLVSYACGRSAKHNLLVSTAMITFWGMARLGELLCNSAETGTIWRHHTKFGEADGECFVQIHLWKAKTAKHGKIQIICLQPQFNVLDPVAAMEQLMLANKRPDQEDLIFAIPKGGCLVAMKKTWFIKIVKEIWGKASIGSWLGHSFRVGGASIRYNLGTWMKQIARQGRWKSLTYLWYLKAYLEEDIDATIAFLRAIEDCSLSRELF